MTSPAAPAFRLSEAERAERYRLLREATALRQPPVITEAGLRLLLESATAPQLREALGEQLRPQLDRLARAGLIDGDGRLNPGAADLAEAVRRPSIQLQIEVAAGRSVRAWKAWLGYRHAVILSQPSPAITVADTPQDVAGREPPALAEYSLQVVLPGWAPVAAARWLGLGPRESPAARGRLPLSALLRRLADPRTPVPGDDPVLARIWGQPMQTCAIAVQPGTERPRGGLPERVVLLDTARTGLWLLATEDDTGDPAAVLTPLPSHTAWRLLLTLITDAGKAGGKVPSSAV